VISLHLSVVPPIIFRFVDRFNLAANSLSLSPIAVHFTGLVWRLLGQCQGHF